MTTEIPARLQRREFVAALRERLPEDALLVSGLGSTTYDLFAAGPRPGNFYLWGAMGAAIPLALGLAIAQPARPVVAITGDGEHLMGIGALATTAAVLPPNLTVVVLDNGHFGETGMQASHTSLGTDLVTVAQGFGIAAVRQICALVDVHTIVSAIQARSQTTYVHVPIETDEPPRALPPRDGVAIKNEFRASLGFATF